MSFTGHRPQAGAGAAGQDDGYQQGLDAHKFEAWILAHIKARNRFHPALSPSAVIPSLAADLLLSESHMQIPWAANSA
jgi:hypothetical protein